MATKNISLDFGHCNIMLTKSSNSLLVKMKVQENEPDDEKSVLGREMYKPGQAVEVYPDRQELLEIISALLQMVPKEGKR
jgi:hypothetical protein